MFEKQIIHLEDQHLNTKTIEVLKRGDKYKLFKLNIQIDIDEHDRLGVFYTMLDEMPEFEVHLISARNYNDDFIDTLAQKPIFKTKRDLFRVLDFSDSDPPMQFEPYEYLLQVKSPEEHDMS